MLYTLENEWIKITANTHGGELHSLTDNKTGTEYLWNGDAAHWKYHAPILFPIVGRVIDNQYRVDGKTFELPQHGLARTSEFTCSEQTDESITFSLQSSPQSREVYPFDFSLQITYTLLHNSVKTSLTVNNTDTKPIIFSIGAHPAFMCPIDSGESLTDCYLKFSEKETAPILPLASTGFLSRQPQPYLQNEDEIMLKKELFQNDALIFHKLKSKTITIKSRTNNKSLCMDISQFPFVGIWAPVKGAPFLCIEPWHGHCDYDGFTGEFADKEDTITLSPAKSFCCAYTVSITA